MKKSNKPLNRAERRRQKKQTLPELNIFKNIRQNPKTPATPAFFNREFLIHVLNRNLLTQPYNQIREAAIMCWLALPEKTRKELWNIWVDVDCEKIPDKYALWGQTLEFYQQEPSDLKTNEVNDAVEAVFQTLFTNKRGREFARLRQWGWGLHLTAFYALSNTHTFGTNMLLAMLNKSHSDAYEYRLTKLLWLAISLFESATHKIPSDDVTQAIHLENLRGYDGDSIKKPQADWKFVYLMHSNTNHYKIGLSKNPDERAIEMTKTPTILPIEITVVHQFGCENAYLAESMLHNLYKPERYKGEWFSLKESQVKQIINIKHFDDISGFVPITAFYPC